MTDASSQPNSVAMDANGGLANGRSDGLANGGGDGLANGGGDRLANGGGDALANGGGDGLANGGADGLANGGCDNHHRTPMPLFFFEDPGLVRVNLRAIDIRNRVSRPVIRFTRHPNYHEQFRIHGSSEGILLLSSGDRLYACNPCTRRWAHVPPLHVDNDIVGFYVTALTGPNPHGDFKCEVLFHDRQESDCTYWVFTLGMRSPLLIGRPAAPYEPDLHLVLAYGIVPSHELPPVLVLNFLHWLPQAGHNNRNILTFDMTVQHFSWIPPPNIQVDGEDVPHDGIQLFEITEHLAMTVIYPARVDVWVLSNSTSLWSQVYHIQLPDFDRDHDYLDDGTLTADVFAVAQDQNGLVQCWQGLVQCDTVGHVLKRYELADHRAVLSVYTIEESLLLYPSILPMQDSDVVGDDPPFFQNQ